jgi:hypothetical protein
MITKRTEKVLGALRITTGKGFRLKDFDPVTIIGRAPVAM